MTVAAVRNLSNLIALPHAVFALPFALAAFQLADRAGATEPLRWPLLPTVLLVVLAVLLARTAALAFNRVVDRDVDRQNPRTASREIPAGKVSRKAALAVVTGSCAGFLAVSSLLGPHCLLLAPFVLALLLGYSYTKRFTCLSHLVLGIALGLAPGGAWWVLRPTVELVPLALMGGVLFWVAGFDTLYSCQDVEFDRAAGLFSLPARVGVAAALKLAQLLHLAAFLCFLAVGVVAELTAAYFLGVALLGALLILQHRLLSPGDLSRINQAFFTVNGVLSIGYLALVTWAS